MSRRGSSPAAIGLGAGLAAPLLAACLLGALPTAAAPQTPQETGTLAVTVLEAATGKPTAFRARLLDAAGAVIPPPEQAIAVMYGQRDEARGYASQPDGSFYVEGSFELDLPAGRYRLAITKGHEYLGQEQDLEIRAGQILSRSLRVERWIDMPALGWYSVDDHVHLRRSPRENPLILSWLAAEDIHVAALLQMGDFHMTAFAQYAWGADGVYQIEDRFLASGQEDPRTHEMGHTISLGADDFVRSRDHYYEYDHVFDRVHELGGLTGYAHQGVLFEGYRGLTLDVLGEKVDFMEVLQFCGDVEPPLQTEYYYHFLDLGFKLTATAGSDFPWCGRSNGPQIGNARFYTYIEGALTFEKWREALRAGHTFASSGPMLELTVNGRIPGEELTVEAGERVLVRARARGHHAQIPLRDLELVVHGETVRRVEAGSARGQNPDELSLELELPIAHGVWIAARTTGGPDQFAHTSPVYVNTGSGFHNPATAMRRLDLSEGYLREIETELEGPRHDRMRNAWRFGCPESEPGCIGERLRERVAETRRVIAELRDRYGALPYPASPLIAGVQWHPETHVQFAAGSDQWPMTVGADGSIYAAWGDGWGWSGEGPDSLKGSIGVTRVVGAPPELEGEDLWREGPGNGFGKPEALIALGDTLYMFWTSGDSNIQDDDTHSAISLDGGATWQLGAEKAFRALPAGFRVRGIVQHGPGYRDALDGYLYVYFGFNRASDLFLARVNRGHLLDGTAYEWFAGIEPGGAPRWSDAFERKQPAFQDPRGYVWHLGVSYVPALDRYLLAKPHHADGDDRTVARIRDSGVASLGLFDAPTPWGPWSTVYYEDAFRDEYVKFTYMIPTAYISADGESFWLAWSGWPEYDNVNFIRGTLELR